MNMKLNGKIMPPNRFGFRYEKGRVIQCHVQSYIRKESSFIVVVVLLLKEEYLLVVQRSFYVSRVR